ncbi:hypothetical protein [Thiorhodovibrio frisius]|uniref:Uncharacterized protein n=1 Tax=Thiorhodovibrio frisius TaxID=631362 RepID=H8Z8J3_9GAMM|nr:hypothetical protein [Thiorhodovibrio frisius]EIC19398.1 hypothetical protein Thi970DRAFT_04917 [Thiorhodovibrio frisius]WPL22300.1 hypothetical protein Thiofri_02460 [Thiorhodovibrio frisius]
MTPDDFIRKWTGVTLKERSAAQEHFLDLCHLLEQPTPAEADPKGLWYAFEKGASKAGGGDGWACTEPERWGPDTTTAKLTEQAAGRFAELAQRLRGRGHDPTAVTAAYGWND